ncbi:MAG TPA: hypothetical protein VJW94_07790 [Candidatus Acidoferrum sp.]|nr:hypothetical protein [Candidatus Acidoferrum sp.]
MEKVQAWDLHVKDSNGDIVDRLCDPHAAFKQANSEVLVGLSASWKQLEERTNPGAPQVTETSACRTIVA